MAWRKVTGVLAAAAAGVLLLGSPAFAATTLSLNPAHKIQTAAGFSQQQCTAPFSLNMTEDGWHFVWPQGGNFTQLVAEFDPPVGPNVIVTITSTNPAAQSTDGSTWHGYIDNTGSGDFKHVFVWTTAGWTLVDATGTGGGSGTDTFNLSHTCPAGTQTQPPGTQPPGTQPPGTQPPGDGGSDSPSPGTSTSAGSGGDLPLTGASLTGLIVAGVVLIAGGTALLFLRRRRDGNITS